MVAGRTHGDNIGAWLDDVAIQTVQSVQPVPAMPTVGLMIMSLLMVAFAAYVLRRRQAPMSVD